MPRAGLEVEGQWQPGFTCYGVEIGSQAYVRHSPTVGVQELVGQVDKVTHLLREDAQAAWVLISTALAHQLDY